MFNYKNIITIYPNKWKLYDGLVIIFSNTRQSINYSNEKGKNVDGIENF